MALEKAKVYFDGSHYIAIPQSKSHTTKKSGGAFYRTETEEKKKAFEKAYQGTKAKRQKEKITEIVEKLGSQFESEDETVAFVKAEMERIKRNLIVRRTRLARKINIGEWNYFCTFTYDDKKHTEDAFRKKLCKICLNETEIKAFYEKALRLEAQMLIGTLVKEIVVYNDKIEIYFHTPIRTGPDENRGFSFYSETHEMPVEIKSRKTPMMLRTVLEMYA